MVDVVEPLEESDGDDAADARADGGTESSGALGFAATESAKNRVPQSVFNRLPTKRVAFVAGAASGSIVTVLSVLAFLFL